MAWAGANDRIAVGQALSTAVATVVAIPPYYYLTVALRRILDRHVHTIAVPMPVAVADASLEHEMEPHERAVLEGIFNKAVQQTRGNLEEKREADKESTNQLVMAAGLWFPGTYERLGAVQQAAAEEREAAAEQRRIDREAVAAAAPPEPEPAVSFSSVYEAARKTLRPAQKAVRDMLGWKMPEGQEDDDEENLDAILITKVDRQMLMVTRNGRFLPDILAHLAHRECRWCHLCLRISCLFSQEVSCFPTLMIVWFSRIAFRMGLSRISEGGRLVVCLRVCAPARACVCLRVPVCLSISACLPACLSISVCVVLRMRLFLLCDSMHGGLTAVAHSGRCRSPGTSSG